MIRIHTGDIAGTSAEAILRPVAADWSAVTAATRRLELAAGAQLEAQCRSFGELPVGSAVITPAGELTARFMIHVVVRSIEEPVTASGIRRGLGNGLRRAAEWGIHHLALLPLGTGAGNLDADESAGIMIPLLLEHAHASAAPVHFEIWADSAYERDSFERAAVAASR